MADMSNQGYPSEMLSDWNVSELGVNEWPAGAKTSDWTVANVGVETRPLGDTIDMTLPRPHRLMGIRPGDHTRLFKKRCANEAECVEPAPVVREGEDDWMRVPRPQVPSSVKEHFGGPSSVSFKINGKAHTVSSSAEVPVGTKLLWYIRERAGLTGTKYGCGVSACGCCTVALKDKSGESTVTHSCQTDVFSIDGAEVTTVEGIGSTQTGLHKVQETVAKCDGTQCGYCTPGMVMSIYGYFAKGNKGTPLEAESCISGNLCRCTGYRPIVKAIHELADQESVVEGATPSQPKERLPGRRFMASDSTSVWLNCAEMRDVFVALEAYGSIPHRIVVGNTCEKMLKNYPPLKQPQGTPKAFINISSVPALGQITTSRDSVKLGATVTLSKMLETLKGLSDSVPSFKTAVSHLSGVASPQVRDQASWAGHVMIAKTHDFPSDVCLLLTTYRATLSLSDGRTVTRIKVEDFVRGGDLAPGQIITQVEIPFPCTGSFVQMFKQHGDVSAGFNFSFAESSMIAGLRGVVGNLVHGPFICEETHAAVVGKELSMGTLQEALVAFQTEAKVSTPSSNPHALSATHREGVAVSLLHKAWIGAMMEKHGKDSVPPNIRSAVTGLPDRPASSGKQTYSVDPTTAPVGEPIEKTEARIQCSGEAKYTADMPWPANTAVAHVVVAQKLATIQSIDASAALAHEGVVGFVSADTVKKLGVNNSITQTPLQIFAAGMPKYVGQIVGLVCATSFTAAEAGAQLVKVQYGTESNGVKETIVPDSDPIFIPARGNETGTQTIKGELITTGQRHFYTETQTSFVVPDGNGGLVVNCATQSFDYAQQILAATLKIPMNKIVIQNVRIGGAYGGKAFSYLGVAAAASVAALELGRPILCQLDRDNDFLGLGGRSACDAKWSADVTDQGRITGLTNTVTADGGCDKSGAFPATSLSAYDISNAHLSTPAKVTPRPWGTIMRSPGEFQGCVFMEAIIENVARTLGVDPTVIQDTNMLDDTKLRQMWSTLKVTYDEARKSVDAFNAKNKYLKQGVYLCPTQFIQGAAVGFGGFNEQATVKVHKDGSVSIDDSGLECGQGLWTKTHQGVAMTFQQQVAADFELDLIETVLPKSTSRFSWSGITPTWGSGTSESVTAAAMKACETISKTLAQYKTQGSWKQIVAKAAEAGANLTATGVHPNSEGKQGYPVPCMALAVVEIDVQTGQTQVLKAEIMQDNGKSLNPAVDVGQIEGCFIQALGFCLTEEEKIDKNDYHMTNNNPWMYTVPKATDIPIEMNVTLPPGNNTTSGNVLGSKATGEPTMCIGQVTFFAVKDAILAARKEAKLDGYFQLNLPASPDRIKAACASKF